MEVYVIYYKDGKEIGRECISSLLNKKPLMEALEEIRFKKNTIGADEIRILS